MAAEIKNGKIPFHKARRITLMLRKMHILQWAVDEDTKETVFCDELGNFIAVTNDGKAEEDIEWTPGIESILHDL